MQNNKKYTFFHLGCLGLFLCFTACEHAPSRDTQSPRIEFYRPGTPLSLSKKNVVLVGGCFDILHSGHFAFLKASKAQGDYLIVALEPDERILNSKGRKPSHTQLQRAQNLIALRDVDMVLMLPSLQGFGDYNQLVQDIHPSIIAVTKGDPFIQNKQLQADAVGGQVKEVIERMPGLSSSLIASGKTNKDI